MKIRHAIRLYCQGKKKYYIHRNLGISRVTVDKYIAAFQELGIRLEQVEQLSDKELMTLFESPKLPLTADQSALANEFKTLEKLLGKPGQTRHTFWLEYIGKNPEGYFTDLRLL